MGRDSRAVTEQPPAAFRRSIISLKEGSGINEDSNNLQRKRRSTSLLVFTSIFGLLYVIFMATESYGTAGDEPMVVRLLFVVFLAGYFVVWKHEGLGGLIFVLWWIGMWYLGLFVAQQDRGAGVVMGLPLFVLAILFIVSWYKRRSTASTCPS